MPSSTAMYATVKVALALIGCVGACATAIAGDTDPSLSATEHLALNWAPEREVLEEPSEISPNVAIHDDLQVDSSAADALRAGLHLQFGTFDEGRLIQTKAYVDWRSPGGRLRVRLDNETDWVELPEGRIEQQLRQLRVTYALNPELALSGFVQQRPDRGPPGINAQLRWIVSPGRELYVVLNHDVAPSVSDPVARHLPPANELLFKLHWDFRI